jgi:hypothetical protein
MRRPFLASPLRLTKGSKGRNIRKTKREISRISKSKQCFPEINLIKLSTSDALDSSLSAGKPKFSCVFSFDSLDIFIRMKSLSAKGIGKLWKLLSKLHKIHTVEIVKQLQNTFD